MPFFSLGLPSFVCRAILQVDSLHLFIFFFALFSSVALSVRVLQDPAIRTQSIRPSDGIGVKNTRKKKPLPVKEKRRAPPSPLVTAPNTMIPMTTHLLSFPPQGLQFVSFRSYPEKEQLKWEKKSKNNFYWIRWVLCPQPMLFHFRNSQSCGRLQTNTIRRHIFGRISHISCKRRVHLSCWELSWGCEKFANTRLCQKMGKSKNHYNHLHRIHIVKGKKVKNEARDIWLLPLQPSCEQ